MAQQNGGRGSTMRRAWPLAIALIILVALAAFFWQEIPIVPQYEKLMLSRFLTLRYEQRTDET